MQAYTRLRPTSTCRASGLASMRSSASLRTKPKYARTPRLALEPREGAPVTAVNASPEMHLGEPGRRCSSAAMLQLQRTHYPIAGALAT